MPILRLDGVAKSLPFGFWLRHKQILHGVTLSVEEGEVYGFLGPNGAGKTTTMKCLLGLLRPDGGTVEVFGEPGPTLAARHRLGYLPEQPYFYPHLSGRELLAYFGRLFGIRGTVLKERCDALLERVGLSEDADKLTRQYSKGMLQRLGIAQALVNDPDLVLFDEPMTGLDPVGRREVKDIIFDVRDRGATVFFSSHILSDAEALCDRVGLLIGGRVLRESSMAGLLEEQVQYWDAASEGVAPDALPGFDPHSSQGDHHYYRLADEEEVTRWVDAVRSAGGNVFRVAPQRTTLEDYFVAAVKEDEDQ